MLTTQRLANCVNTTVARNLAVLLARKGLTPANVAEWSDGSITYSRLYNVLNAKNFMTADLLALLLHYTKSTAEELFSDIHVAINNVMEEK